MTTVNMEEACGTGSAELDLAGGAWRPTATRREVNCPPQRYVGWMVGDDAVPAIRCWISDVSRSHARIRTFGSAALPDAFTLHFPAAANSASGAACAGAPAMRRADFAKSSERPRISSIMNAAQPIVAPPVRALRLVWKRCGYVRTSPSAELVIAVRTSGPCRRRRKSAGRRCSRRVAALGAVKLMAVAALPIRCRRRWGCSSAGFAQFRLNAGPGIRN
jgi:hypothetical protein